MTSTSELPSPLRRIPGTPGSPAWWEQLARLGTPLAEPDTGGVRLTFAFRAPERTERVLIDVNGATDHHSHRPAEMTRTDGTDAWWWSTVVRPTYRGSYRFVPVADPRDAQPPPPDDPRQPAVHREWWLSMLGRSVGDPLNPYAPLRTPWETPVSAIHLPGAPDQAGWEPFDRGEHPRVVEPLHWKSVQLANERRVWAYQIGNPHPGQPLVLLLDGDTWADRMPVVAGLDAATARGLPPCLCVLVDAIDIETRARELPCHEPFWQAVRGELLPLVAERHAFTDDPRRTVVAGQSFGGLAAVYAALHWPERFGAAVSQSGSFWRTALDPAVSTRPVRVVQEVGRLESTSLRESNLSMRDALVAAGHDVSYREFEGGHELLCWRGGLVDALIELLG